MKFVSFRHASARVAVAAALLLALAPLAAQAQRPAIDQGALAAKIDAALEEIVRERGIPGMTAAVVLPGGFVVEAAAGLADKETGEAMTAAHRMPAGSIGKTFVAAAALALVAEGKMDLDDKAEKYLGDRAWFADWPNADAITLRMLLNHSTGVPRDYIAEPEMLAYLKRTIDEKTTFAALGVSHDDYAAALSGAEPAFEAGAGFLYTDISYVLAALMVEAATGRTLEAEVDRRFLAPLGLRTTAAQKRVMAGLAPGYITAQVAETFGGVPLKSAEGGEFVYDPEFEWGGGGYVSTAGDLARWAKAFYSGAAIDGDYLPLMKASLRDEAAAQLGAAYGPGLQFKSDEKHGERWFHGGYMIGYIAKTEYLPRSDIAVAIMINTVEGAYQAHHQRVVDLVLEAVSAP